LDLEDRATLFARGSASDPEVRRSVAATIERVRREGDAALRDQMRQFHGVELEALEVPRPRWSAALSALDPPLRAAMDRAAANIEKAHRAALPRVVEVETEPGIVVGRRPDPFARVGIYAPGGRATYPSTVLMGVIPARVVGVPEIVVVSPPGPDGAP